MVDTKKGVPFFHHPVINHPFWENCSYIRIFVVEIPQSLRHHFSVQTPLSPALLAAKVFMTMKPALLSAKP
jgi:hypothetical protein